MKASKSSMNNSKTELRKQIILTEIRDWCMDRIALHSLAGDHDDAQAMTEEHMEMLMEVNPRKTLWMTIEETMPRKDQTKRKI